MKYNNYWFKIDSITDILQKLENLGYQIDIDYIRALPYIHCVIRNGKVLGVDRTIGYDEKIDKKLDEEYFKDYVFNINDTWTDDVDYVEHLMEELEYNLTDTIEIGEKVPVLHKDIFNLRYLTEEMQEQAYEIADEYAEDYLNDLTTEKAKELESLILDWLNKNIKQPNFFNVKNEKEITIKEFRERFL